MKITQISTYDDFLGIKKKMNNLLAETNQRVFSTWEWLSACWKHFGRNSRLLFLLAENGNDLIGIAPLMYSVHQILGLRYGKIQFIGTLVSDYNDFIIRSKEGEKCIKLFLDHLNRISQKWVSIELDDVPEDGECLHVQGKMFDSTKLFHWCPYVLLPNSYEIFLRNMKRNLRKNIFRTKNLSEKTFDVDFVDSSKTELVSDGMQCFFELHEMRWQSKGHPCALADPKSRMFNLDVAKSFSHRGWLGLYLLKFSGEPVAALYGFKYKGTYYEYLSGFNPRYYKYSVLNLLRARVIEECIRQGLKKFDFLRGTEEYKYRWSTLRPKANFKITISRRSFLGRSRTWLCKQYEHGANTFKYLLKMK